MPPSHSHRPNLPLRGRGTAANPKNRFERLAVEPVFDDLDAEDLETRPETLFLRDASRSVITSNSSPDVPFAKILNPYRGCEHGCSYCYARPFHEFLGFSAGLDFETKIVVKEDAAALLRRELLSPRWVPQALGLSGATDAYQPIERRLGITRACLEVLAEFRNPVSVVTKNRLVTRDADHLASLAEHGAASVAISITTLDGDLARSLEPRASHPRDRLQAIRTLSAAGVPVGVLIAPVIPGLNDHEIPALIDTAKDSGARFAGYAMLRLPGAVEAIFSEWLENHAPLRKERVLARLREMRGGALHDGRFGKRMRGEGVYADEIGGLFQLARRRAGLEARGSNLSAEAFRRPGEQLGLF